MAAIDYARNGTFQNLLSLDEASKKTKTFELKEGWDEVNRVMQLQHPDLILTNRQLADKYRRYKCIFLM